MKGPLPVPFPMRRIRMPQFDFDQYGLIIQTNGDGGDSGARTGLYYFLYALLTNAGIATRSNLALAINNVTASSHPLMLFRNPVNYNDPKDFSRDQTNPLIMAMGVLDLQYLMKDWWSGLIKRYGFYQNKDFAGPHDWGMYFRARRLHVAYPFLLFSDLFLVLGSIIRCIKGRDPNDVGDDINHTMMLIQAMHSMPTPVSWLARKIYAKFRPFGVQYAWDWYFRPSTFANPFNELVKPIIQESFT